MRVPLHSCQTPARVFVDKYKTILKCIETGKGTKIAKTIWKKKNKVGGISLPDFKSHYKQHGGDEGADTHSHGTQRTAQKQTYTGWTQPTADRRAGPFRRKEACLAYGEATGHPEGENDPQPKSHTFYKNSFHMDHRLKWKNLNGITLLGKQNKQTKKKQNKIFRNKGWGRSS